MRVEDGSGTTIAEYYYDPFGRRLWKEAGGSRTYFGYADEGLIAEYDASGNQTREYGYAPGSTWSTNPLFLKQGSTYYWYQNDHQGRPQKIVTSSGAVVWSATYDSFGNCQVDASSTITNNLHGPGQYHDAETGLYYNLNRYYDPQTGRYLTTDPIEDGLNLYAYCFNDPVNLMDPEGLCALRIMGGLAEMAIGFTFGTATSPTIAGGVIGVLVMAHGADQVYAGLKGLLGYDDTSYTSGLLQSLGFTPTQANLLDSAASVVATAGIGAVSMARSATVASTRAASAAQGLLQRERLRGKRLKGLQRAQELLLKTLLQPSEGESTHPMCLKVMLSLIVSRVGYQEHKVDSLQLDRLFHRSHLLKMQLMHSSYHQGRQLNNSINGLFLREQEFSMDAWKVVGRRRHKFSLRIQVY